MKTSMVIFALLALVAGVAAHDGWYEEPEEICNLPCNIGFIGPVIEDDCNSFFTCGQLNATLYNDCPDGFKFSGLLLNCLPVTEGEAFKCGYGFEPMPNGCFSDGSTTDGNFGFDNTGKNNRGSGNSGSGNIGNDNSGDNNLGDDNSGSKNRGDQNSGSGNDGSGNTGTNNQGGGNTGSGNQGDKNTGSNNFGSKNSGNNNLGSGVTDNNQINP